MAFKHFIEKPLRQASGSWLAAAPEYARQVQTRVAAQIVGVYAPGVPAAYGAEILPAQWAPGTRIVAVPAALV